MSGFAELVEPRPDEVSADLLAGAEGYASANFGNLESEALTNREVAVLPSPGEARASPAFHKTLFQEFCDGVGASIPHARCVRSPDSAQCQADLTRA